MEKLHLSNNNIKEYVCIKTENVRNEFIKVKNIEGIILDYISMKLMIYE